ncbi:hypothetical protein MAIT1_01959 [Magnetofaba australis IT-1]|uniref:DUF2164 domain-containing protein n=2 Tax=Magnetofaba TaxID=1472292 RepID=A0A1Y2K1I6_9PROT|nr:hypothetical protein MAIT1_01959 [Magnetofaba australis IT-1]
MAEGLGMARIQFTEAEREDLARQLQDFLLEESGQELGRFEADALLTFITEEMGGAFYNQGVRDARAVLQAKLADIDDALEEIVI